VAVSPDNAFVECISVADLKKIWEPAAQGTILRWSDVRPDWPDEEITLYGAGADSGTFDYFTEAVVGKAKASRGDYTASEDDNVLVQGIENDDNALGYIPFAYYAPHADKLKALAVDWGRGQGCVQPSLEAVVAGTYNPLSRPLFVYVSKKAADERPEVAEFVEFAMRNAAPLIKEVQYLPLPQRAYEIGLEKFHSGKTGSVFGGVPEVGVSIEEVLGREARS
jgi:phosphate transport system substrate-binding protein